LVGNIMVILNKLVIKVSEYISWNVSQLI